MKRNLIALAAALVLSGTAIAQTGSPDSASSNGSSTTTRNDDTHHGFDYGWLGLIGLAGLAGLRKNDNRTLNNTTGTVR